MGNFTIELTRLIDARTVYERQPGCAGYRYALGFTDAQYLTPDSPTEFETNALMDAFESLYSCRRYNVSGSVKSLEAGPAMEKRWFASGGWQSQMGRVRYFC